MWGGPATGGGARPLLKAPRSLPGSKPAGGPHGYYQGQAAYGVYNASPGYPSFNKGAAPKGGGKMGKSNFAADWCDRPKIALQVPRSWGKGAEHFGKGGAEHFEASAWGKGGAGKGAAGYEGWGAAGAHWPQEMEHVWQGGVGSVLEQAAVKKKKPAKPQELYTVEELAERCQQTSQGIGKNGENFKAELTEIYQKLTKRCCHFSDMVYKVVNDPQPATVLTVPLFDVEFVQDHEGGYDATTKKLYEQRLASACLANFADRLTNGELVIPEEPLPIPGLPDHTHGDGGPPPGALVKQKLPASQGLPAEDYDGSFQGGCYATAMTEPRGAKRTATEAWGKPLPGAKRPAKGPGAPAGGQETDSRIILNTSLQKILGRAASKEERVIDVSDDSVVAQVTLTLPVWNEPIVVQLSMDEPWVERGDMGELTREGKKEVEKELARLAVEHLVNLGLLNRISDEALSSSLVRGPALPDRPDKDAAGNKKARKQADFDAGVAVLGLEGDDGQDSLQEGAGGEEVEQAAAEDVPAPENEDEEDQLPFNDEMDEQKRRRRSVALVDFWKANWRGKPMRSDYAQDPDIGESGMGDDGSSWTLTLTIAASPAHGLEEEIQAVGFGDSQQLALGAACEDMVFALQIKDLIDADQVLPKKKPVRPLLGRPAAAQPAKGGPAAANHLPQQWPRPGAGGKGASGKGLPPVAKSFGAAPRGPLPNSRGGPQIAPRFVGGGHKGGWPGQAAPRFTGRGPVGGGGSGPPQGGIVRPAFGRNF